MFRKLEQRQQKFYKQLAAMVSTINSRRSTIKTEIYKTSTPKRFHALLHKVLLNYPVLREIVRKTDFMKNVPLGAVIAYEVLTKKIRNDGFRRQFKRLLGNRVLMTAQSRTFVRINTLKGTEEDLSDFVTRKTCIPHVYEVLDSERGPSTEESIADDSNDIESYDESAECSDEIENPENNTSSRPVSHEASQKSKFKRIKDLFTSPDVMEKIKVQNFSSCLPAFILNPEPGSTVIDAAASPGNKTTHLCSIMENTGRIFAFERNKQRYDTLVDQVSKYGASNVTTVHKDFLKASPEEYRADYVLLDPSCSGSGIHINYKKDQKRIDALHNFQAMMLNHAFKFSPKAIVYSTCSHHKEEGEDVVKEALEKHPDYDLETIGEFTKERGCEGYDFKDKVIRTGSGEEGTVGFFVALFRRRNEQTN